MFNLIPLPDDLLPEWRDVPLHPALKEALLNLKFTTPTEIQKRSLPVALRGKDIVGVAETVSWPLRIHGGSSYRIQGSGKTLAYSLPILSRLLEAPLPIISPRPLSALLLCPTRELALQVVEHLQAIVKHAAPAKGSNAPPRISIGSVVGGLSAQKQQRIVERGCDILIATPGRLWDLIQAVSE